MPKNIKVEDIKPKNEVVFDAKPKNLGFKPDTTDRLYDMTLEAGMLVGFGPHITYPEDITVISSKSP